MHLFFIKKSQPAKISQANVTKSEGGIMKQSFISSALRHVGMTLATFGFAASMFVALSSRVHALTISVGTPTVVSGVTIDQFVQVQDGLDNRIHVFYSTSNSTDFSIMLASNNGGGGYTLSTISTGTLTSNNPKYLNVVYSTAGEAHIYYWDSSSNTINYFIGTAQSQSPKFLLGTGKVTATGLNVNNSGSGYLIAFSSLSAAGSKYSLEVASVSFGFGSSGTESATSFITALSSAAGDVTSGLFDSYLDSTDGRRGIVYYDDSRSALKLVYIDAGAVVEASREIIDSGVMTDSIYALDASNVTRIAYTLSGVGAKYAVQRRNYSRCWYIQKIDDGTAQTINSTGIYFSYIKSGNLWLAAGQAGVFFDDFSETITNAQRGLSNLGVAVSKGGLIAIPNNGTRPAGIFKGSGSGTTGLLASVNFLTLSGNIDNSFGTNLYSTLVRANITDGGAGAVTTTDLDPAVSATQGGKTDSSGNYSIYVASGATTIGLSVSSSTRWAFAWDVDHTTITLSTATTGTSAGGNTANFIGISSAAFDGFGVGAFQGEDRTFSQNTATITVSWTQAAHSQSSFSFTSANLELADRFSRGGTFRFVPQSAKGATISIVDPTATVAANQFSLSTGTVAEFNATDRSLRQVEAAKQTEGAINVSSAVATFRSLFASTDTAVGGNGKWYTVVYSTFVGPSTGRQVMQGYKADALHLQRMMINGIGGVTDGISLSSQTIITSTQAWFTIVSFSSNGPTFPRGASGTGDSTVGYVFLSTTTDLSKTPLEIGATVQVVQSSSTNNSISGSANIFGLSTGPWYVRVSTQIDGVWHSAISAAIVCSTPVITAISAQTGDSTALIVSSANAENININGQGLTGGTTIWITTSSTFSDGLPGGDSDGEGAKVSYAHNASVSAFSVKSSSWATATFIAKSPVGGLANYFVYIGTSSANKGKIGVGGNDAESYVPYGIAGSTVVMVSPTLQIKSASMSVTSIVLDSDGTNVLNSSAVANTRSYALRVTGVGLVNGSSVTFILDGSSSTAPASLSIVGNAAQGRVGTVTVDFAGQHGGKAYSILIASDNTTSGEFSALPPSSQGSTVATRGLASLSGSAISFSPNALWVSSMSISTITTPIITNVPNGTMYNSTLSAVLTFEGVGLVGVSSVTFSNATTLVSYSTRTIANGNTNVINDGRKMFIVTGGTATATAGIPSIGLAGAPEGLYSVTVTTAIAGADGLISTKTATATLTILKATVTSVSVLDDTNYGTMQFATYTITGVGLMNYTTASIYLQGDPDGAARMGNTLTGSRISVYSAARTSATASFDLRSATTTASTYVMAIVASSGTVQTDIGSLNISSMPIVNTLTSTSTGNNGEAAMLTIYGRGLSAGATVTATYASNATALSNTASELAGTSATFVISAGLSIVGSSGTTATVTFPTGKMPGTWNLSVSTFLIAGTYTGANKAIATTSPLSTGTVSFSVAESSAPNAPTGLTVLSAGVKTVTLRWISPGDDGTTGTIKSGGGFVVYYSSGENTRGQGCAPCYPVSAAGTLQSGGSQLTGFATNYNFANTWAYFLPSGHQGSLKSSDTTISPTAFDFATSSVKGLSVTTVTLGIADVTVNGSANTSAIVPGSSITATLTIDPGAKDGEFWFIVRAKDEAGNISPSDVVYTTASAIISKTATVSDTIDPNVTTTLTSLDLGGGVTMGGEIPAGALDGADTMSRSVDSNPPTSSGVDVIAAAVDITLGSGKTEFKKPITLTFTLTGAGKAKADAADSKKVKVAFYNGSRWVVIASDCDICGYDKTTGILKVKVSHLTKFAAVVAVPATNLSGAIVYPNPFRPAVAVQAAQKITFDLLPVDSDVKIYTLAGELVKQLKADASGTVLWDAKNEDGKDVASGVYFALLKGGGDKKTLKIAVQR